MNSPAGPALDARERITLLYQEHSRDVLAYARRRLRSSEDAEDVVVEVFATAWRRRDDLPEEPLPWLYATAGHVISHVIRAEMRRTRLGAHLASVSSLHPSTPDPAPGVVDALSAATAVTAALEDLSPSDAELLRLWAWEQLEPAEIAAVLSCAPGTARVRLHRARTRLREALARRGIAAADLAAAGPEGTPPTAPTPRPHPGQTDQSRPPEPGKEPAPGRQPREEANP